MGVSTKPEAEQDPGKLSPDEEKKVLEEARRRMRRGLDRDNTDRKRAEKELRFVWNLDNCQWDDATKKKRGKGRPILTENRNPAFVKQATNEVRRSRPQIRVLPVDGQGDPMTAQVMEGLIRNIEANSRADMSYDQATESAGYCGRGYWKVTTKYQDDGFDQDIVIEPVPDPFSIVDDPDCAMPDKSDRKFAFEVERFPRDDYPYGKNGKAPSFEEATEALGEQAADWGDKDEIVVANYWRVVIEKQTLYLMSDGKATKDPEAHIAEAQAQAMQQMAAQMPPQQPGMQPPPAPPLPPPPFVKQTREVEVRKVEWFCIDGMNAHSKGEWAGQYIPLVYTTSEQMKINGTWQTKGMTFDAQDLTKANNYLLSTQIENIALTPKQPFIGPKGAFESDRAKWNSINTEAYSYVQYDPVDDTINGKPLPPPMRAPGVTAQPEIANVRMGVIDGQRSVVGLMGASLGDGGPEVAFKAIEARQSRGDTAVFHVMDNLVRAVRYGGMVIVDLMPRVYSAARVVRIINPDGEPMMQAINKLFLDDKDKQRFIDFSAGKFDVSVSAGPAFETQRQQNNALLVDLVAKVPQIGMVAPDLITKQLLTTGEGEKIAQRLARTLDKSVTGEGPSPAEQKMGQQLQMLQQQMGELTKAKDFAESELMKQRSLLEKAGIDNDTARTKLQQQINALQGDLQKADLELQKKELEVQKAELALIRASLPPAQHPAQSAPPQGFN